MMTRDAMINTVHLVDKCVDLLEDFIWGLNSNLF